MARRRKSSSSGGVVGILLLLALGFVFTRPLIGVPVLIGVVILAVVLMRPGRCGVCSNTLKRAAYTWQLGDKQVKVCPHCNQRLEREQSRAAFRRR